MAQLSPAPVDTKTYFVFTPPYHQDWTVSVFNDVPPVAEIVCGRENAVNDAVSWVVRLFGGLG